MGSDDYGILTRGGKMVKATALLLIICFQVNATGQSQDRVTLKIKDGSLESVLKEIRRQTGYLYALQDQWKDKAQPIDISVTNVTVEEALDICFRNQPFTYRIIRKTIVVEDKEDPGKKKDNSGVINSPGDGISGTVKNEDGAPLAGATIEIKKLNKKVVADEKGEFLLTGVPNGKYEVVVTFVGYEKYEAVVVVVDNRLILPVSLKHTTSSLDEVQIIAYGTTTRRLNTGDVTTVTSKEIEEQPVSNPLLALEGRVPGMFITQTSGLPGSAAGMHVQIRGLNSLQQGSDPLYIVDGLPYISETPSAGGTGVILESTSGNPFNFLNPADIESISVLKDADATAIYGSRGANGVVLITTKKGKEGNTRVDVNVQNGFGEVAHKLNVLDNRQYLDMRYEAFQNDGATPNPNVDYDLTLWDTTRSTDWQKELIGGTAQYTDLQSSLSGGNANTQFVIGAGYHKETTVFPGDWNDQKASLHFSINNSAFSKKLKVFLSGSYIVDDNDLGQYDLTQMATQLPPDGPTLYNPDGSINWAPNAQGITTWPSASSPVDGSATKFNVNTNNLIGNAGLSYQLLRGLDIKATLGYTNMQNSAFSDEPFAALDPSTWPYRQRESRFANNHTQSWIIEPQATYNKDISKGILTALIGTTIEQNAINGQIWNASGFSSDLSMENILAATSITAVSSTSTIYKYNAGFGRLNYNWEDKYLLNFTLRRDGSSRFGPDNRFANFYAIGGGWIFSKENIIRQTLPQLSFGKLRASYGTTGNDQVGDYTYLDLYNSIPGIGVPYQGANGIAPTTIYTPNLQWELTRKLEAGLELGFFKDRLLLTSNYYLNRSSDQLLSYPLPGITGFTTVEENVPAVVQNQGWEIEMTSINLKTKYFHWTTSINFTRNRNILRRIAKGLEGSYAQLVGHSLSSVFLYHFAGVDPITGVNEFADAHGDKVFNPNPVTDRTVSVDLDPKFFGGVENSLQYKSVQLDFLFQFVNRKSPIYLYNYIPGYEGNEPTTVLNRWRQPGDVSNIERFSQNGALFSSYSYAQSSNLIYGNGSYVRLKNLSISYLLPQRWTQSVHFQSARVFVHGQNLLTFTRYQGLDPETISSITLPILRVISMGIEITL